MDFTSVVIQITSLLIAFSLHEAGHAYCANYLGDKTAKRLRRLTLNPIPHLDPFGSVILPLVLIASGSPFIFAAAKPVPVQPGNFKRPITDFAIVALAGPIVNILLAILGAALLGMGSFTGLAQAFLIQFVWINIVLALFNMIPIPPLDGSKVIAALMPRTMALRWLSLERYGFLLLGGLILLSFILPVSLIALWVLTLATGLIPILNSVSGLDFFTVLGLPTLEQPITAITGS